MEMENRETLINLILENAESPSKIKEWIQERWAIVHEVIAENTEEGNKALAVLLKYGASTRNVALLGGGYFESSNACFQYPLTTAYFNRNLPAFRMLCQHGVNEKQMWYRCGENEVSLLKVVLKNRWKDTDSKGAFTDEVVQLMLRHGASINEPCEELFLHAHPANMWALAEAGADYSNYSNYGSDKKVTALHFSFLKFISLVPQYQLEVCMLLAMGDAIENTLVPSYIATTAIMIHYCCKCCDVIVSSGYRSQHLDYVAKKFPELAQNVEKFKKNFNKPLSLEQLAANVIRPFLKPNTVVGAKRFVEEGVLAALQTRKLTLDLTARDFKKNWCNCCDSKYNYLY